MRKKVPQQRLQLRGFVLLCPAQNRTRGAAPLQQSISPSESEQDDIGSTTTARNGKFQPSRIQRVLGGGNVRCEQKSHFASLPKLSQARLLHVDRCQAATLSILRNQELFAKCNVPSHSSSPHTNVTNLNVLMLMWQTPLQRAPCPFPDQLHERLPLCKEAPYGLHAVDNRMVFHISPFASRHPAQHQPCADPRMF